MIHSLRASRALRTVVCALVMAATALPGVASAAQALRNLVASKACARTRWWATAWSSA